MAVLSMTIPDALLPRIFAAIHGIYGPNPVTSIGPPIVTMTDAQWAKQKLIDHVIQLVTQYEMNLAAQAASDAVTAQIAIT